MTRDLPSARERLCSMEKMCAYVGMIVGSSLGGWLGGQIGLGTMIVLSAVGAGFGFYLGRKVISDFLD